MERGRCSKKMMAPHEDEIENRASVTQLIPSFEENPQWELLQLKATVLMY